MKLLSKMGTSILIALGFFCTMPQVVFAEELTNIEIVDDYATIGVAETEQFSLENSQMTEEQHRKYEQMLLKEGHELTVANRY